MMFMRLDVSVALSLNKGDLPSSVIPCLECSDTTEV